MNILDLSEARNRNLGRILCLHAQTAGEKPCLLVDDTVYSYAQINQLVNRFASGLRDCGVEKGDRVVIFMHSCVEFILASFAANKLGAIWVPINTDYKGIWLAEAVKDSRGRVMITDTELLPRLQQSAAIESGNAAKVLVKVLNNESLPEGFISLESFNQLPDEEPDISHIQYGDTSAILWTSGTTGKSKGVMQSHNYWVRAAESAHGLFGTQAGDVIYNCLPLYNTAAWVANIYRAIVYGLPCALDKSFSVHEFWGRIRHYRATETITLGAMHMFLWNLPESPDDANNTLRCANVIPLPENLVEPFRKRFGLQKMQRGYGQSESALILRRIDNGERQWKPNCLGEVAPGIELKLMDDEGNEVPPGQPGEFCIKPLEPYVIFNGYFDNPQATASAYFGDWYRTGDLGIRDAEGDFFFMDRKSDFIRYKGRNVSSLQVEAALMSHPAVEAVAAFGIASKELASEAEIKVDVILKAGAKASPEELAAYVNENAPYFFVPRYIEFVDSLPYTPTNKVQKYKLRDKGLSGEVWDRETAGFVLKR